MARKRTKAKVENEDGALAARCRDCGAPADLSLIFARCRICTPASAPEPAAPPKKKVARK